MSRLPDLEQNPAFAAATIIGNKNSFRSLGFDSTQDLLGGVSFTEALAETEKVAYEKDESGRYKFRPDVCGPAVLGLSRLLNHEMDALMRDAWELIYGDDKIAKFWETFDVELAKEKEKTLEQLSQTSSKEPSQQAGVSDVDGEDSPGLVIIDGADQLAAEVLGEIGENVVVDPGLEDMVVQVPEADENVVDENVDPDVVRPKRTRKKVQRDETGDTGLKNTTVPVKRKTRKRKTKVLNVIEDAALQVVNDELVNEVNELQNNFVLPNADNALRDDEELPLQDVERQSRLMRENNLMLREEPIDLRNRGSVEPGKNTDPGLADGFGTDHLGGDNVLIDPTGNDVFLDHGNPVNHLDDPTFHDNFNVTNDFDFAPPTAGPSTSHQSVERGRGNQSHVNEGISAGPNLDPQTPNTSSNSATTSVVHHQPELPAQSTSNIQQATAVELPQAEENENDSQDENVPVENRAKKRRRKRFLDPKLKITLNYKTGEHGILQLIQPFEAIELPGKIPKPFQKRDFGKVFGRPMAAQLQDMVLSALDHHVPINGAENQGAEQLEHQADPPLNQTVETGELSTVVVAEEYPTMLENLNENDQGTHNDTTHVVSMTSGNHQLSKERARDNNDPNQDEMTSSRLKRTRSLSNKRSPTRKSQRTPSVSTPTGNLQQNLLTASFQNRLPSPATAVSMEIDFSPDLFDNFDLNQSLTSNSSLPSDEIMILRQRIIDAAAVSAYFQDEFNVQSTRKAVAAFAFFQTMVVFAQGQIYILQRVPTCEEITEHSDEIHPLRLVPYSSKSENSLLAILPPGHVALARASQLLSPIASAPTSPASYASQRSSPIASTSRAAYANQRSSPIASTSRAAYASQRSSPIASTSRAAYTNQRSSPIASTSRAALARDQ